MASKVNYRQELMVQPHTGEMLPAVHEDDSSINWAAVFETLKRRRKTILLSGLIFLFIGMLAAFALATKYTSEASFIPPGSSSTGASALAGQLAQLSGMGGAAGLLGGKSSGDTYAGILKSREIMDKIINRFDLMTVYKVKRLSDAEKKLTSSSNFTVGTKDPIVSIAYTDKDPKRARDVVNGYLQALQQTNGELALTESSQRRLFFEGRLNQEKNALADAEVALKEGQEKTGLVAPAGQTATEIQAIAQLRSQEATRRVRLASLLRDQTEQSPEVISLRSEIASLEGQIAQMERGKTGPSGAISNAQVPALQLEYVRLAREVKYHETLFEIIARQYEAARLDEAHDIPLQILDHANLPDKPSGPPRLLIILGAFVFGVFVSSLYVIYKDRNLPLLADAPDSAVTNEA